VDHQSSGKIEGAQVPDPAAHSPNPMSNRIVDEGGPENKKDQIGFEFKPFSKSPRNQGGCDDRKHHLKDHKGLMRNGG
jgi:hypothetical protein